MTYTNHHRRRLRGAIGTGCAATMVASTLLLAGTPAQAAPAEAAPAEETVTDIAPNETDETYALWHQGNPDSPYSFGLIDEGLMMTGKSQVIKGYDDNDNDLSEGDTNVEDLGETLDGASYELVSGDAWFQVALFFDNTDDDIDNPVFTTLRPAAPATTGTNEIDLDETWTTSAAIDDDHGKGQPAPLDELVTAIGNSRKTIAFGVFTDTGRETLVKSINWRDTTYTFKAPATGDETVVDREIGWNEQPYAGWHQGSAKGGTHEVTTNGLELTGNSQVMKGYDDNTKDVNSRNLHLQSALEGGSYTVEEGKAWFQVPLYFTAPGQTGTEFTTLRPAQPAETGSTQQISLDDEWVSSKALGSIPANTATPLRDLIDEMTAYKVLGFGVFSDTGGSATVKDVTWNHTKYTFTDERTTGEQKVFFKDIAPAESPETYAQWHQGAEDAAADSYEVTNDGLALTGKSQVTKGYGDGDEPQAGIERALTEASYTVESGDAWFQLAIGWADGGFTTLRPALPAAQGENEISLGDQWMASRAIGDVPSNTAMPLSDLVDAVQGQDQPHMMAFGVFTDTDRATTVSSIDWDGTTYDFVNRAPTATRGSLALKAGKSKVFKFEAKVDRDGNPVTYDAKRPLHGKVEMVGDYRFKYTPHEKFAGKDRVPYTVTDPYGESDTGYVVVKVSKLDSRVTGVQVKPKKITPTKHARVTVRVMSGGKPAAGQVQIRAKRILGQKKLQNGKVTIKLNKLKRGKHKLTARYLGSKVSAKASKKFTIRVVRR